MKSIHLTLFALLSLLVTCRVLPLPRPDSTSNATSLALFDGGFRNFQPSPVLVAANDPTPQPDPSEEPVGERPAFWHRYVCRGRKLHNACLYNKDKAVQYATLIDSPFDGTLEAELKLWSYQEGPREQANGWCGLIFLIKDELRDLGINHLCADQGGPNEGYVFWHYKEAKPNEEPTYVVDGRTYRITNAMAAIAANAKDGIIHFLNVRSAYESAKQAWGVENPPLDQLPALRQISDMAWGMWRRQHLDGQDVGKIKKFIVHTVVNDITMALIEQALKTYTLAPGTTRPEDAPVYPGVTFFMNSEEGAAMLGSPNGIAVGYFLAQHKTQLGGNKYVFKVQIFNDQEGDAPYMIFWVADDPLSWEGKGQQRGRVEGAGKILKRSLDGKNVLREHVTTTELRLQDVAVQA